MKINKQAIRKVALFLSLMLLIASLAWTWISWIPQTTNLPSAPESSLTLTPEYEIVSRQDSIVWPSGTVLPQGSAAYFYSTLPLIKLMPAIKISTVNESQLDGILHTSIILQAINDKGQSYWSYPLQEPTDTTFSLKKQASDPPGDLAYEAPMVPVDAVSAYSRATQIGQEIGFENVAIQLVVQTSVQLKGTLNNQPCNNSLTNSLPIDLNQVSFSLPKAVDQTNSIQLNGQSNTSANVNQDMLQQWIDLGRKNGLALSINAAILLFVLILLLANSRGKRARGQAMIDHRRFREWITEGSFQVRDAVAIQINSLEGLVDLAIDIDKRVIFDPVQKKYYVPDEKIVYVHDPFKDSLAMGAKPQLGRLLLDIGVLNPQQLETALYYQQRTGTQLGESLIALGFIDEEILYSTLASQLNLSFVDMKPEELTASPDDLAKLTLQQARVLLALPLGKRSDGKMVVACGDPSRKAIRSLLAEIFQCEIALVIVRPSVVREVIESLAGLKRQNMSVATDVAMDTVAGDNNQEQPSSGLSATEWKQFISSYIRGSLPIDLFQKTLHQKTLESSQVSLLHGLSRAIGSMDWKDRQEKKTPELITVLQHANYLTPDDVVWANREAGLQKVSIEQQLVDSCLVSAASLQHAAWLLKKLENVLSQNV